MSRIRTCVLMAFFGLMPSSTPMLKQPEGANVHLKFYHAKSGNDLGMGQVTRFQSQETGRDYSTSFRRNTASEIPYGTYFLRAHQEGFWSYERTVIVNEPNVWVAVGLHLGMDHVLKNQLSGRIQALPATKETVWVRIASVRSSTFRDAIADDSGSFYFENLPDDVYVLIVWSGAKVLDIRQVELPSKAPLVIDLASHNPSSTAPKL